MSLYNEVLGISEAITKKAVEQVQALPDTSKVFVCSADLARHDHTESLWHLRHPDITVFVWQVNQDLVAGYAEV